MPEMKAPFYGHVRQYHGIKKELDDAILQVLESSQYVMGPALKQFEGELARYFGMKHAVGLNSGTDALWLAFLALGIKPGDEIITTANTFFATAEADLDRGRQGRVRGLRPRTTQHRPREDRGRHHAAHGRHRARPPLRPVRGHEGDQRDRAQAQAVGGRGQRAVHRRPRPGLEAGPVLATRCARASSSRRTWAPSATAARWSRTATTSTRRCAGCATTARPCAPCTAWASTAASTTCTRPILSVKLKHITRWTDRRREIAARYTQGLQGTSLKLPYEPAGYRHAYPPLRGRDPGAPRWRSSCSTRAWTQAPLPDRHPPAGGVPLGQAGRPAAARSQLRAERRRMRLAAHVPGADRRRGGLHHRAVREVGPDAALRLLTRSFAPRKYLRGS